MKFVVDAERLEVWILERVATLDAGQMTTEAEFGQMAVLADLRIWLDSHVSSLSSSLEPPETRSSDVHA